MLKSVIGNKIIIALDGVTEKKALRIAYKLKGLVWGFKVGDLLFANPKIIGKLKKFGKVFADAKLYDIPNTVAHSTARLTGAGADMITVHASGGAEMIKAAKLKAGSSKILAVTILTSAEAGSKNIERLTRNALKGGADGVVCSGHDISRIDHVRGSGKLLKVVPGIRPRWYGVKDDQKRITTPEMAIKLGADYLVIGRRGM